MARLTLLALGATCAVWHVMADQAQACDSELAAVSLRQLSVQRSARSSDLHGSEESADAAGNNTQVLCRWGKWLPELYVLGAPNFAAKALSSQLVDSGIESLPWQAHPDWHTEVVDDLAYVDKRESHFFHRYISMNNRMWNVDDAEDYWRNHLPDCPSADERRLFGDYTPTNMALVRPDWSLTSTGVMDLSGDMTRVELPATLETFYGQLSPRLTFIAVLREPLSHMQAAWYHSKSVLDAMGTLTYFQPLLGDAPLESSFVDQLEKTLWLADAGTIQMWLWQTMYGWQLQSYLSTFDAQQFVIIPMKYFLHLATDQVCASIQQRLNYPISCHELGESAGHVDVDYPNVEDELPATSSLRVQFDSFMSDDQQLLVKVLLDAHADGAHLPAFDHLSSDATSSEVKAWLTAGW